ncbi:hypothetical protein V8C34DRAFT_279829 [Trichoderma compactum]
MHGRGNKEGQLRSGDGGRSCASCVLGSIRQRISCGEQTAVPQQGGGDAGDDRHRGPLIGSELWKHANFLDSWCWIDYPWIFLCLSLMGISTIPGTAASIDAEKHGFALLSRILGFFYCTPQISTAIECLPPVWKLNNHSTQQCRNFLDLFFVSFFLHLGCTISVGSLVLDGCLI